MVLPKCSSLPERTEQRARDETTAALSDVSLSCVLEAWRCFIPGIWINHIKNQEFGSVLQPGILGQGHEGLGLLS